MAHPVTILLERKLFYMSLYCIFRNWIWKWSRKKTEYEEFKVIIKAYIFAPIILKIIKEVAVSQVGPYNFLLSSVIREKDGVFEKNSCFIVWNWISTREVIQQSKGEWVWVSWFLCSGCHQARLEMLAGAIVTSVTLESSSKLSDWWYNLFLVVIWAITLFSW